MSDCGVYVHIPFCKSRCSYCAFCSTTLGMFTQKQYFSRLWQEINSFSYTKPIKTIFFGGGTPSAVDADLIVTTLKHIYNKFIVLPDAEITLEANPNALDFAALKKYVNAGFNRISFGAQSFEDCTLKKLGRTHGVQDIFSAVQFAQKAGFDNVNIDLILGAETLNRQAFCAGIQKAKKLGVTHISCYILMLEEGTPLWQAVQSGKITLPSEDEVSQDYYFACQTLENFGFLQYEVSNFALSGFQCQHNLNYWHCNQYLAFGLSAHGYVDGVRFANTSNMTEYLNAAKSAVVQVEVLTNQEIIEEYIMLSLRLREGLNLQKLQQMGCNLLSEKKNQIDVLLDNKMLEKCGKKIRIAKNFQALGNAITLKLL